MKVREPNGTVWRVRRRWLPWRRQKLKGLMPDWIPSSSSLGDDPISLIIGLFVLILCIPLLILMAVVALELLLLLLLFPFVVLARILFGHQWVVEAHKGGFTGTLWWHEPSGDWSQSGRRIKNVADLIARGQTPPHNLQPRGRGN